MVARWTKVWLNVCSIEHRLSVFASDRALTTVCIKQALAKAPLTFAHCLRGLITPNFCSVVTMMRLPSSSADLRSFEVMPSSAAMLTSMPLVSPVSARLPDPDQNLISTPSVILS